jgi:hypothetical protein
MCECPRGALQGPLKNKGIFSHKYKMKNLEILLEENPKIRAIYNYLATGIEREGDSKSSLGEQQQ